MGNSRLPSALRTAGIAVGGCAVGLGIAAVGGARSAQPPKLSQGDLGQVAVPAQARSSFVVRDAAPRAAPTPLVDQDAMHQASEALRKKLIASYSSEGTDPTWSAAAMTGIREPLLDAARSGGFEVREVECHTTTCLAVLRYASYLSALEGAKVAMHLRYGINCARTTFTVAPPDPAVAYDMTMVFECPRQLDASE